MKTRCSKKQLDTKTEKLIKIKKILGNSKNIKVSEFIIIPADVSKRHYKDCKISRKLSLKEIQLRILQQPIDKNIIDTIFGFLKKHHINKAVFRPSFYYKHQFTKSYDNIFAPKLINRIDKKDIEKAIKEIWLSPFDENVLKHSGSKLEEIINHGISVIVQRFTKPQLSGFFLGSYNKYYCEMFLKPHDNIIGDKEPDLSFLYYKFSSDSFNPVMIISTKKQELLQNNLKDYPLKFNELLLKIKRELKTKSCYEIEFTIFDNVIYIVQVRNLTCSINTVLKNIRLSSKDNQILPMLWKPTHISWDIFSSPLSNTLRKLGFKCKFTTNDNNGIIVSLKDLLKMIDDIAKNRTQFITNMINIFTQFIKHIGNLTEFKSKLTTLSLKEIEKLRLEMWSFFCSYEFLHALYRERIIDKKINTTQKISSLLKIQDYYKGKINTEELFNSLILLKVRELKFNEKQDLFFRMKKLLEIFAKEYIGYVDYTISQLHSHNQK